jgi:hypothetical protein
MVVHQINIRINNIGFTCEKDIFSGKFVRYYNNKDYDTLEEKYANGWEDKDGYITKGYYSMSKRLVDKSLPECQYVIAWLKYNKDECVCDLESVANRLLDLPVEDRENFFEVYKIAEKKMRLHNEDTYT